MLKFITVLAATMAVVLGASTLAGAAGSSSKPTNSKSKTSNAVLVVPVLGKSVKVPFHQFVMAYAFCPKGYYVTGGGSYNGAISEVVSGPLANMRGWYVDGTNDDLKKRTFQHSADAVCVKGTKTVPVAKASASSASIREAEAGYAASHWGQ